MYEYYHCTIMYVYTLFVCVCELLGVHLEGPPRGDALPAVHIKENPGPSINLAREVTPSTN